MELQKLELENFRQFEDEVLAFAQGPEKGVTVVHGSNGSGKTTLLNAFTWLFYGEVDFDTRPDRLVNEGRISKASPGEKITVAVQLAFSHEETEYLARREAVYEKRSQSDFDGELMDMDLSLKYRSNSRESWSDRGNPSNSLDQIIPERLSNLFFFDGEDIKELAGVDNQAQIQEAIQNIMGLTILERATSHLGKAGKRFEDEVEEHGSDELKQLIEQKRDVEDEIEKLKRKRKDEKRAKEQVERKITKIEQTLERFDESAALQERRNELQEEIKSLEERIEQLTADIRAEIGDKGFLPLAMPLLQDTAEKLDQMRTEGVIPSELSNSYIDSLLDANRCICGRSLDAGTEPHQHVSAMKGEAVADGVEQSALRIVGNLNQMSDMESSFHETVREKISDRKQLQDRVTQKDEEIDEITSELEGMDQTTESGETVSDLENERNKNQTKREEHISEIGRIEERIDQKHDQVEELEQEIDERRDEREEALVAKRRQRAAELVEAELDEAFGGLKNKVRQYSNQKIKGTFDSVANKNLTAEITEDFELKIKQDVGGESLEVDKSTGERQISSLTFIGSLVDIARKQYEADSQSEYFTGGIYPLVMDSPFGALDKNHRRKISEIIPTLANQVVVLATDSQWEGPVESEMSPMVGKQYWLDFDEGSGTESYPRTRIVSDEATARSH